MQMMFLLVGAAELAEEGHVDLAEHVEDRDPGADPEQRPHNRMAVRDQACQMISSLDMKPANGGTPQSASVAARKVQNVIGMLMAQAAHLAHVLLAAHRMDDGARAEEQAGLEERVGHQVEDAGGVRAHADRREHVAELADGRVGEHLLDVVLRDADSRGEQRGQRADDRRPLPSSPAPSRTES